jgi:ADP-heptose:LPS heptosyltransferase
MIGDALLLTPLLAKLQGSYPTAEILFIVSALTAPLYSMRPYGVSVMIYRPGDHSSFRALQRQGGFDLAIVPGDSRYAWFAKAVGARWTVGFSGDNSFRKTWMLDESHPYSPKAATWGEMAGALVAGPTPAPYRPQDWHVSDCNFFKMPQKPYCVLHVGASTALKRWKPDRWRYIADVLSGSGYRIVWSGGPGEQALVDEVDPTQKHISFAGKLDLLQVWHLLANASLLLCPDTSVAHMGRLVNTPTVVLFGPGSPDVCGPGVFWSNSPYRAVRAADFSCRDQNRLFGRSAEWLKRCGRSLQACRNPGACMDVIQVGDVINAIEGLGLRVIGYPLK